MLRFGLFGCGRIDRVHAESISGDPVPSPAAYISTSSGPFRDMTIHDFDLRGSSSVTWCRYKHSVRT